MKTADSVKESLLRQFECTVPRPCAFRFFHTCDHTLEKEHGEGTSTRQAKVARVVTAAEADLEAVQGELSRSHILFKFGGRENINFGC